MLSGVASSRAVLRFWDDAMTIAIRDWRPEEKAAEVFASGHQPSIEPLSEEATRRSQPMTFNSDLRDEKPKPKSKSTEEEKKPTNERKLDEALKQTFPASPVASETPVTGTRARLPKPPR